MEGAGILLITIAIALMLVPPIHVTVVRPLVASAAIGEVLREQYVAPFTVPGRDDLARCADTAIAELPDLTSPPFSHPR